MIMHLTQVAGTAYDSLLALVYPQACAVCGGSVESQSSGRGLRGLLASKLESSPERKRFVGNADCLHWGPWPSKKGKTFVAVAVMQTTSLRPERAAPMKERCAPQFSP